MEVEIVETANINKPKAAQRRRILLWIVQALTVGPFIWFFLLGSAKFVECEPDSVEELGSKFGDTLLYPRAAAGNPVDGSGSEPPSVLKESGGKKRSGPASEAAANSADSQERGFEISTAGTYPALIGSFDLHILFYTFIALAVIWMILLIQNRRFQQQSKELRDKVSLLSAELQDTRDSFSSRIAAYEQKLHSALESERSFRDIFETIGAGTLVVDDDGLISMVNTEFERITGYFKSDVEGRLRLDSLLHRDDAPLFLEHRNGRSAASQGASPHMECRILDKAGDTLFCLLRVSRLPGTNKDVVSLLDITYKKRTQQDMLLLAQALRSVNECVSVTDLEDNIIFVNDAFLKTYGYTHDEIIGKNCAELRPASQSLDLTPVREKTLNGHWHGELINVRKDGTEFPIELSTSVVRSDDGAATAMIGVAVDITERKAAEERLKDSEERYRSLFTNNVTGVYLISESGDILDCNDAFARIAGCDSREAALRLNARDFYENPIDRKDFLESIRREGSLSAREFLMLRQDGTRIWVLESVRYLNGTLFGTIADISERKVVEEQSKRVTENLQRLNSDKDKFFSIISHDLRSPLSVLHGYTELLHADSHSLDAETITMMAASMHALTARINGLLENLLDWSRLQAGRMPYEPVRLDLGEIVDAAVDLLRDGAERKKLTIRKGMNGGAIAKGDRRMIASVMQNLMSNAIKFTEEGGRIEIKAAKQADELRISVSDTGIGMTQQQIDSLFRLDVNHSTPGTAHETGSGIGLILCKELIEHNEGRLLVESSIGSGSTFAFTLPVWTKD